MSDGRDVGFWRQVAQEVSEAVERSSGPSDTGKASEDGVSRGSGGLAGLRLDHVTERDPSLTHQVVFGTTGSNVFVSCNCRREWRQTGWAYDPIGYSVRLSTSREMYNKPGNHWKPFGVEDRAKW